MTRKYPPPRNRRLKRRCTVCGCRYYAKLTIFIHRCVCGRCKNYVEKIREERSQEKLKKDGVYIF